MHFLHKIAFLFLGVIGVLAILGYYLAPQDELRRVDAIVAVSGGDNEARTETAVELYQSGWADQIIFSGAARDPQSPSNAEIMKREAIEMGVSKRRILTEELSQDTRDNASNVAELAKDNNIDSMILVTSPYHQRRAFIEFQNAFEGQEVTILNYSAKDQKWRRSQWWISPRGWYLTTSESLKIAFTELQNFIGS